MSKITDTGMSRSEALIMDYLWEEGTNGKMFSEFMAYLSNNTEKVWAKQTVNTFLRRLIDKGLIRTEMRGRKKVYYAALTIPEYEKVRTRFLLDELYEGSVIRFLSAITGGRSINATVENNLRAKIEEESK